VKVTFLPLFVQSPCGKTRPVAGAAEAVNKARKASSVKPLEQRIAASISSRVCG
jgi:hypothetical protein